MENNPYNQFNPTPTENQNADEVISTTQEQSGFAPTQNKPQGTPPTFGYNQAYTSAYSTQHTPGAQSPGGYTTPYTNQSSAPYNTPQYHYGDPSFNMNFNNEYYHEQRRKLAERKLAEQEIRHYGNISGIILIGCMVIATIFSVILVSSPIYSAFTSNVSVSSFLNMIYTMVVVGGSFTILCKLYKPKKRLPQYIGSFVPPNHIKEFKTSFSAPKNKLQALLLIIISFGGCMFANYISSILLSFISLFGAESTYSSIQDPKSISDLILMCISVAVIPPLIEEYALRGVTLSRLRRYGNSFAIIATSIMFGIFHGDAMQIPFAFMCGLFFAYSVIATESLWTGIIIHALNNILSCVASVIMQVSTEDAANTFFSVVSIGGMVLAVACVFIYYALFKKDGVTEFKGEAEILTTGQKVSKFLFSPGMIIAIIFYGIQALSTLNFS